MSVHGPQITVFVSPFIPDADAVFLEVVDGGVAGNEPQEFVDDGFQVDFLGGQQRKSILEVEPHLVAEQAGGPGSGAVAFEDAFRFDFAEEVEVLLHTFKVSIFYGFICKMMGRWSDRPPLCRGPI